MAEDGFERMIDEAADFFAALRENNSKAWFDPRKADYQARIRKPADLFAGLLAEDFGRIDGRVHVPKQFRIHRDIRFSKDKSPFNTHLHILWTPVGGGPFDPAFFFGVEPGRVDVAAGVLSLSSAELARFRAFIDRCGDALVETISEAGMSPSDWGPAPLKRVPAPYGADHPQGHLLRRKGLVIARPLGEGWRGSEAGLLGAVRSAFEATRPFAALLARELT